MISTTMNPATNTSWKTPIVITNHPSNSRLNGVTPLDNLAKRIEEAKANSKSVEIEETVETRDFKSTVDNVLWAWIAMADISGYVYSDKVQKIFGNLMQHAIDGDEWDMSFDTKTGEYIYHDKDSDIAWAVEKLPKRRQLHAQAH
jgi:hypothetical protein